MSSKFIYEKKKVSDSGAFSVQKEFVPNWGAKISSTPEGGSVKWPATPALNTFLINPGPQFQCPAGNS